MADIHERASGVPCLLAESGVIVAIEHLPRGDYAVGGAAVVERKTVRGMHAAILAGTFWRQLGRLRQATRLAYLLIEGTDLDDGPLSPAAIRGTCVAVSDLGIGVFRSVDARDSALWLQRLASRRQRGVPRNRPAYAQRPKRDPGWPAAEAALACVPGVSTTLARALLDEFGSLRSVVTAEPIDWQRVRGIGPSKANALAATFRATQPTSRSQHR